MPCRSELVHDQAIVIAVRPFSIEPRRGEPMPGGMKGWGRGAGLRTLVGLGLFLVASVFGLPVLPSARFALFPLPPLRRDRPSSI